MDPKIQKVAIIQELTYDYTKLEEKQDPLLQLLNNPKKKITILKQSKHGNSKVYQTVSNGNFTHQFIQMLHYAYYNHYPFSFTPDNIQLLISQGFCAHIKMNAEKFKHKFVSQEGQKILKITAPHADYLNYDWQNIISQFSGKIKENINEEKYKLCVHKFSTTDQIAQTCYEVSLMDTMQKYFKYVLGAGCGISKIKLLGTLEDWVKLKESTEKLREFELDWWIDKIIPVLEQFIQFYQGNVDQYFWKNIYRFCDRDPNIYEVSPYYATGWITYFFPYIKDINTKLRDGEYVENDFSGQEEKYAKLIPKEIPSGISNAPVLFVDEHGNKLMDIEFNAGYFGVGLDEEGFLYTQQGWAVTQVEEIKQALKNGERKMKNNSEKLRPQGQKPKVEVQKQQVVKPQIKQQQKKQEVLKTPVNKPKSSQPKAKGQ